MNRGYVRFGGILSLLCSLSLLFLPVCAAADEGFSGVGIQAVPIVSGELAILNVFPGSPAQKTGLLPGDLIVKVDNFPLEGSNFEEVVRNYLWGPVGTILTIHYLRPGVAGARVLRVERVQVSGEIEQIPGVKLLKPQPD